MNPDVPSGEPPIGCPMHTIRGFGDIRNIPDLVKKAPSHGLDGGADWKVWCHGVNSYVFSSPGFFRQLLLEKYGGTQMINCIIGKERAERAHEVLFLAFNHGVGRVRNYSNVFWEIWGPELRKKHLLRLDQLVNVGVMNFERFFLQRTFEMIDAGRAWSEIESCFVESPELTHFFGMSDTVNTVTFEVAGSTASVLDADRTHMSLCPMDAATVDKKLRQTYPRPYKTCMLLGAPGVRGKTLMDDFFILYAMAVYQFEMLEREIR